MSPTHTLFTKPKHAKHTAQYRKSRREEEGKIGGIQFKFVQVPLFSHCGGILRVEKLMSNFILYEQEVDNVSVLCSVTSDFHLEPQNVVTLVVSSEQAPPHTTPSSPLSCHLTLGFTPASTTPFAMKIGTMGGQIPSYI